jgi:hypothetical protein
MQTAFLKANRRVTRRGTVTQEHSDTGVEQHGSTWHGKCCDDTTTWSAPTTRTAATTQNTATFWRQTEASQWHGRTATAFLKANRRVTWGHSDTGAQRHGSTAIWKHSDMGPVTREYCDDTERINDSEHSDLGSDSNDMEHSDSKHSNLRVSLVSWTPTKLIKYCLSITTSYKLFIYVLKLTKGGLDC